MNPPRRILIVRTDRLGDVILTLPMARAIKIAMPDAHVGFYCREYTRPIVERCPDVDEVIVQSDAPSLRQLIRALHGWDAAFFPNARPELAMAAFLARVRIRVGTAYRFYSLLFNRRIKEHRKNAERHEAEYNLRMLCAIGIDADPQILPTLVLDFDDVKKVEHWRSDTIGDTPFTVLHPGSGGSSHVWPTEHWLELARSLQTVVVLTGSNPERASIEAMRDAMVSSGVSVQSFVGHSLGELAVLLRSATAVVSGSTGPGHLAAALGTPTIGLFPLPLALSKERWGFRGRQARNISPPTLADCPNCSQCNCRSRITPDGVRIVVGEMSAAGQ